MQYCPSPPDEAAEASTSSNWFCIPTELGGEGSAPESESGVHSTAQGPVWRLLAARKRKRGRTSAALEDNGSFDNDDHDDEDGRFHQIDAAPVVFDKSSERCYSFCDLRDDYEHHLLGDDEEEQHCPRCDDDDDTTSDEDEEADIDDAEPVMEEDGAGGVKDAAHRRARLSNNGKLWTHAQFPDGLKGNAAWDWHNILAAQVAYPTNASLLKSPSSVCLIQHAELEMPLPRPSQLHWRRTHEARGSSHLSQGVLDDRPGQQERRYKACVEPALRQGHESLYAKLCGRASWRLLRG